MRDGDKLAAGAAGGGAEPCPGSSGTGSGPSRKGSTVPPVRARWGNDHAVQVGAGGISSIPSQRRGEFPWSFVGFRASMVSFRLVITVG